MLLVFSMATVGAWCTGTYAASALAVGDTVDEYGWGVARTRAKAAEKAVVKCIENGCDEETEAFSVKDGPGWSAIFKSKDGLRISHTFGWKTKRKAIRKGKELCENSSFTPCVRVKAFYDKYDPEGKKVRRANRHQRIVRKPSRLQP
jgi:hypothetical protein